MTAFRVLRRPRDDEDGNDVDDDDDDDDDDADSRIQDSREKLPSDV